ncbi:ester cyclase [Devosia sp. CN2-171]|uniref:ester cyclase n=1 Tax=Devosia sp. CN2-171 TaxID=3400909 RepID=UPI003BF82C27
MDINETNKQRYVQFYKGAINDRNYALVDETVSQDVISHDAFPGQPAGPEGLKQTFSMFHRAFPDLHAEEQIVVAGDDLVAARFLVTGTHKGEFMGQAATGNPISYTEAVFVRFRDGKIVEHWAVADVTALMAAISPAGGN